MQDGREEEREKRRNKPCFATERKREHYVCAPHGHTFNTLTFTLFYPHLTPNPHNHPFIYLPAFDIFRICLSLCISISMRENEWTEWDWIGEDERCLLSTHTITYITVQWFSITDFKAWKQTKIKLKWIRMISMPCHVTSNAFNDFCYHVTQHSIFHSIQRIFYATATSTTTSTATNE